MGDKFTPSQKWATDFNNGDKYKKNDGVQASTINNLIESALWVQGLAFGDIDPIIQTGVQDVKVNGESVVTEDGKTANISVETSVSWDFTKDDIEKWESIGTDETPKYQIRIQKDEYIKWFNKIISVTAEKITELGSYENMVYSRKWFLSGSVAIITNYPIDIHITIKGTK